MGAFELYCNEMEQSTEQLTREAEIRKNSITIVTIVIWLVMALSLVTLTMMAFYDRDGELHYRRRLIRSMTKETWATIYQNQSSLSQTQVLAAASTLYLMNLSTEFHQARSWIASDKLVKPRIASNESILTTTQVNAFMDETIGALVSAYALTNESLFLVKAQEQLEGLDAYANLSLFGNDSKFQEYDRLTKKLEVRYLTDLSPAQTYWHLNSKNVLPDPEGVAEAIIRIKNDKTILNGNFTISVECNLGLEYAYFLYHTRDNGSKYRLEQLESYLNVQLTNNEYAERRVETLEIATNLTKICHDLLDRTTEERAVQAKAKDLVHHSKATYNFAFKLSEMYFVMWRLTHAQVYRDYAWELTKKVNQYLKGGNQQRNQNGLLDREDPIFLSGTLKYLYLTFLADEILNLDEWSLNAVGHPIPICGRNRAYPAKLCERPEAR